ncbi:MAG: hypothetical protein ACE5JX_12950 [Acidobacteriota bacterium]
MRARATLIPTLLLMAAVWGGRLAPQRHEPLRIGEIFSLLWDFREHRTTQREIAAQVDRRGIAFRLDEATLSEIERQGAGPLLLDAIHRAGKKPDQLERRRPEWGSVATSEDLEAALERERTLTELPLIEQARVHALEYARALPNFLVFQEVKRYIQAPGTEGWKLQDTLEVELAYRADTGEDFKLLRVDGAPTQRTYAELGGSTSTGEFGSILASLFAPQTDTSFKEVGGEQFHSRQTLVYEFNVLTANSMSQISDKETGRTVISGYEGRVWVDVETGGVLRIEESHNDIPAGFPVTLAENAVDYDWVTIAGKKYLMPVQAEVLLGEDRRSVYARNVIRFSNYRKFEVEVKIRSN